MIVWENVNIRIETTENGWVVVYKHLKEETTFTTFDYVRTALDYECDFVDDYHNPLTFRSVQNQLAGWVE